MIGFEKDINEFNCPLLTTAIHNGHIIRPQIEEYLLIDEFTRLREEDPFTEFFINSFQNYLVVNTSRFEVDLNRPPEEAIYRTPEQAWGLNVWKDNVPVSVWQYSIQEYDFFYNMLKRVIDRFIDYWGYIIVYDIHSYNYKRDGTEGEEADPSENPDINIGTGSLNRKFWGDVVESFTRVVKDSEYNGRKLIVGENVKFKGGYLGQWIHSQYPDKSCVLSIEIKKIFMDEWTGAVDIPSIKQLKGILKKTVEPVLKAAAKVIKTENIH
ncbi:MAG TPA: N-formylglutamate amidohydrolase [Mariniphaga sp.]|nr:N-formylglutamate amidohydrolase [Mariniphaga sp.]